MVVPRFAQTISPTHSSKGITPDPTKARIINDTTELLCKIVVTKVPIVIERNDPFV
ncbi:MAG: hypothetical protein RL023_420 [Candidatus Parcubacteria bacterium]